MENIAEEVPVQGKGDWREEAVRAIIDTRQVTSHFQPIVDLHRGTVLAWEVLSRGPELLSSPAEIFAKTETLGLLPELEEVCRDVALCTIARLPPSLRSRSFFINVSPNAAGDPDLRNRDMRADLARLGLDQRNFVVEIAERESVINYAAFERQIRHYLEQGFKVALANLGAGDAGLITLVTRSPHFMKLDMTLSREIHRHSHKQHLVKSLVAFSASIDAALIAEGVETWDELETLARLGVRYAQGFLFAQPSRVPSGVSDETRVQLRRMTRQFHYRECDLNETVGPLAIRCATIREKGERGEDVNRIFRHRFKEYNDCYGFLRGDEMLRCLARVLSRILPTVSAEAKLGHLGGDDFVIVSPTAVAAESVAALCRQFDLAKLEMFDPMDVERGHFRATDRRGQEVEVPLVTLSVAVVPCEAAQSADHPAALAQMAASLKRKAKEMTAASRKSGFLFERRRLTLPT